MPQTEPSPTLTGSSNLVNLIVALTTAVALLLGQAYLPKGDDKPVTPVVIPDAPPMKTLPIALGDIAGPNVPVLVGSRCSISIPEDVEGPLWAVVPPKLDTGLTDNEHTLQLSTDTLGEYTVLVSGIRAGKSLQWQVTFTISEKKPTPTPTPAPTPPTPTPTPPTPTPTPAPVPVGPVVPTPSAALQAAVLPIKTVMAAADKTKATTFAQAWADLAGEMGTMEVATLSEFKQTVTSYTNAVGRRAGLVGAFPGFSAALEQAFIASFSAQDGNIDAMKAVDFVNAVAWACLNR